MSVSQMECINRIFIVYKLRKILHFILILLLNILEYVKDFSYLNLIKRQTRLHLLLIIPTNNDLLFISMYGRNLIAIHHMGFMVERCIDYKKNKNKAVQLQKNYFS